MRISSEYLVRFFGFGERKESKKQEIGTAATATATAAVGIEIENIVRNEIGANVFGIESSARRPRSNAKFINSEVSNGREF